MLFSVLSELIVCVVASFEIREVWIQQRESQSSTPYSPFHTVTAMKQQQQQQQQQQSQSNIPSEKSVMPINDRKKRRGTTSKTQGGENGGSQQIGSIMQFYSQSAKEPDPLVLHIYGANPASIPYSSSSYSSSDQPHHHSRQFHMNCCQHAEGPVLPADLLFSFDNNELYSIFQDSFSYDLSSTMAYFATILQRIQSQYGEDLIALFTTCPYLNYLYIGENSIPSLLGISLSSSSSHHSFTKTPAELRTALQTLVSTSELSLEVIPLVGYLVCLLRHSQTSYQKWIAESPALSSSIQRCYSYCVKLTSIFVASENQYAQGLVGELLGLLGAVAAERFDRLAHEQSVPKLQSEFDLTLEMIKHYFVKDLRGLPHYSIQNRIAYTAQCLLRFLQRQLLEKPIKTLTITESVLNQESVLTKLIAEYKQAQSTMDGDNRPSREDPFPVFLQKLFTPDEYSVIAQYWSTKYNIRDDKARQERSISFDGIPCRSYSKWVSKIAMRLVLACPAENLPSSTTNTSNNNNNNNNNNNMKKKKKKRDEEDGLRGGQGKQGRRGESDHGQNLYQNSLISTWSVFPSPDSVIYIMRTLLGPLGADKASFLLPHIFFYAVQYHFLMYKMMLEKQSMMTSSANTMNTVQLKKESNDDNDDNEKGNGRKQVKCAGRVSSADSTPPIAFNFNNQKTSSSLTTTTTTAATSSTTTTLPTIHAKQIPFCQAIAGYLNTVLRECSEVSDDEYKQCCNEILSLRNTFSAWSLEFYHSNEVEGSRMLREMAEMIQCEEVIRVAKILGQYEYALR